MNTDDRAFFHPNIYPQDLEAEIDRIDGLIFESRNHPKATIYNSLDTPADVTSCGVRCQNISSFFPSHLRTQTYCKNVINFPVHGDYYAIWHAGVDRKVKSVFQSGFGDAKLKQVWLGVALALVRARVRKRPVWFTQSTTMDMVALRRYAVKFGPSVFIDMNRLKMHIATELLTSSEIDARLTALIIMTLLSQGMPEAEALELIITI